MINMNMFFDFVITIKPMFTVKIFYIVPFKKKKVFIRVQFDPHHYQRINTCQIFYMSIFYSITYL
jgi:hypothetical protein